MSSDNSVTLPSIGGIIYIAIKPLIRLLLPALAGALLYRAKLLNEVGMRNIGQVILNVLLPSLLFSKVVPSITNENLPELGIIILVAVFYQGTSAAAAVIMRAVVEIPSNFRHGFLAAAIFSNWGDLPTAVIQTVTSSTPFGKPGESDLAIAYVSIFILVYFISFFPLRGSYLIKKDYDPPPPPALSSGRRIWRRIIYGYDGKKADTSSTSTAAVGRDEHYSGGESTQVQTPADEVDLEAEWADANEGSKMDGGAIEGKLELKRVNRILENAAKDPSTSNAVKRPSHVRENSTTPTYPPTPRLSSQSQSQHQHPVAPPSPSLGRIQRFTILLRSIFTPPTIALLFALIIAFVPTLKALFLHPTSGSSPISSAPDGLPPLSVFLDAATFLGNASVPMGLIVLGGSLASMQIKRPISNLPLRSILGLAAWKLVILPVLGVVLVRALTDAGLVERENKVLRFVLMYFACVPTATTQVIFTQVYAPEGRESNSHLLAVYLIVQYIVLAFSSVVLTALILSMLF
ncbi:auxin efflux carrier [Atractiella rhizophila]|nr:auxin efflux carrier [Atractiella rhizophila]